MAFNFTPTMFSSNKSEYSKGGEDARKLTYKRSLQRSVWFTQVCSVAACVSFYLRERLLTLILHRRNITSLFFILIAMKTNDFVKLEGFD